jgi:hypothetical protein
MSAKANPSSLTGAGVHPLRQISFGTPAVDV